MGQYSLDDINWYTKQMFIGFLPVFYLKVMKVVVIRDFVIAKKKGKW